MKMEFEARCRKRTSAFMKRTLNMGLIVILSLGGSSCGCTGMGYVPSTNISTNMPVYVRMEVERLRSNSSPVARYNAARNLGTMRAVAAPAVPHLIEALEDTCVVDWIGGKTVAVMARVSLTQIGAPAFDAVAIATRENRSWVVRKNALIVLTDMTNRAAAVPYCIHALEDRNWEVRYMAILGLNGQQDCRAVANLISVLQDRHQQIRDGALTLLVAMTGQHYGNDVMMWRKWWNENSGRLLPSPVSTNIAPGTSVDVVSPNP